MGDPMPSDIPPMLAIAGDLPGDADRWALEIKWDGVRTVTYVADGDVRAVARRGIEATTRYPELRALTDLLPGQTAVLDGEVVAFDGRGRPSFARLRHRMHVPHPDPRLVRRVPVHYVVFDLLYLNGHVLCDLRYADRRALLKDLDLAAGPIESPPHLSGAEADQVAELLDYTREQRLEGLIAKRLDSPYRPGRRVDFWRKIKHFHPQDVVLGGRRPGKGRREGGIVEP